MRPTWLGYPRECEEPTPDGKTPSAPAVEAALPSARMSAMD
jgi:hypothetical protein